MLDSKPTKEMEKKAWKIVGDPAAKEEKWMAACNILKGKKQEISSIPKPAALVISSIMSLVGAMGGSLLYTYLLMYGFLFLGLHESNAYFAGLGLTVPFAFQYFYTSIFTYQKHKWKGGKSWTVVGLVPLVLICLSLAYSLIQSLLNFSIFSSIAILTMIAGMILAMVLSKNITTKSIENQIKSLGSAKLFEFTKYALCTAFFVLMVTRNLVFSFETAILFYAIALNLFIISTSYFAVRANKITSPKTSYEAATFIWSPVLVVLTAYPFIALIGVTLYNSTFDLTILSSTALVFASGLSAFSPIILGSLLGGEFANKRTQLELSRELGSGLINKDKSLEIDSSKTEDSSNTILPNSNTA